MTITVIKPGMLSSFQDMGRHGAQHLGIPVSGAMDTRAHRLANALAGNAAQEATLEITLTGPVLRFETPTCMALAGALLSPAINGEPIPNNRPLIIRKGDILSFGVRQAGARAYLAVHGGYDLPPVMGSRSTFLGGGFGGLHGRALRKGDVIPLLSPLPESGLDSLARTLNDMRIYLPAIVGIASRETLRLLRSHHTPLFTEQSLKTLLSTPFRISPNSERMGYRLQGPRLSMHEPAQLLSEPTSFGSIQVPADGNPIILMADRQSTGGYPKIAHVAAIDVPQVAQGLPGDTLRFREISLEEAQSEDVRREQAFARLDQELDGLHDLLRTATT